MADQVSPALITPTDEQFPVDASACPGLIYAAHESKTAILLQIERAFRDDWRFLHRMRIITAGLFIGLATTLVGWGSLRSAVGNVPYLHQRLFLVDILLTLVASVTMAWFASSLNALKRSIVRVETALGLFKPGVFLDTGAILSEHNQKWGHHTRWFWGKAVFLCVVFGALYAIAIMTL
jgi:hypothetical protein